MRKAGTVFPMKRERLRVTEVALGCASRILAESAKLELRVAGYEAGAS
jgi:hypothetical protein